ncbi:uncharacterized protein LOC105795970 [Gossypium raimondii]|uniref:uncharacterized protein LOC105795970 n=1 Tax=Gossypium raimondii TaxID=29730 RepID=UPI00063AA588|nr:uncharacterized protein LOC105795970 [Gossypium raimondii]
MDHLKYMMELTTLNGIMARWKILLFELDILYVNQKEVKESAIADFLASRALEDYEPLNFDFPNEDLMYVATTEEEYVTCIIGIRAAIERKIKVLEVYEDSALVIYQLKGEWETRDPKLIDYRKLVLELIKEFDDIILYYLSQDENQMVDAFDTLVFIIKVNKQEDMKPIQMNTYESPTHCYNIKKEERDDHPWYEDILRYEMIREYPEHAIKNDKRTLKRLANEYVLDGEILYKRRKDQMLLRCVDVVVA